MSSMAKKPVHYSNYEDHPKQRQYIVFYFYAKDHADYFESLLIAAEIPYERGAGKDLLRRHLFGIHKSLQARAEVLNDETGNMFRRPFLADNMMRIAVLSLTLIVLLIALMGWWRSA